MYNCGLKVAIFSCFLFFLSEACSEKKDPSQYQREDSLIRYKQLDLVSEQDHQQDHQAYDQDSGWSRRHQIAERAPERRALGRVSHRPGAVDRAGGADAGVVVVLVGVGEDFGWLAGSSAPGAVGSRRR